MKFGNPAYFDDTLKQFLHYFSHQVRQIDLVSFTAKLLKMIIAMMGFSWSDRLLDFFPYWDAIKNSNLIWDNVLKRWRYYVPIILKARQDPRAEFIKDRSKAVKKITQKLTKWAASDEMGYL